MHISFNIVQILFLVSISRSRVIGLYGGVTVNTFNPCIAWGCPQAKYTQTGQWLVNVC